MKDYIQGLIQDPMFNLGVGLLQSSGPRPVTSGFGDVLAGGIDYANTRQGQVMEMNANRQAMADRQSQKEAQGLLAQQLTPEMGLLMQANPQQFVESMTENMLTPSTQNLSPDVYSAMQILGVDDPTLLDEAMAKPGAMEAVLSVTDPNGLAAMRETQRLTGLDADTRAQEVKNRNLAMDQTIGNIIEAMDINEKIADKLIATGDADAVRTAIATGANLWDLATEFFESGKLKENEYSKLMSERQNLNAIFAQIPMEMMSQYDGGTTNAFLTQWNDSKASENNQPLANNMILSRFGNDLIEIASSYKDGPYSETNKKLDGYIDRLNREFMPGGPAPQTPGVLDFNQLNPGL